MSVQAVSQRSKTSRPGGIRRFSACTHLWHKMAVVRKRGDGCFRGCVEVEKPAGERGATGRILVRMMVDMPKHGLQRGRVILTQSVRVL
jgi:hypothetical protein